MGAATEGAFVFITCVPLLRGSRRRSGGGRPCRWRARRTRSCHWVRWPRWRRTAPPRCSRLPGGGCRRREPFAVRAANPRRADCRSVCAPGLACCGQKLPRGAILSVRVLGWWRSCGLLHLALLLLAAVGEGGFAYPGPVVPGLDAGAQAFLVAGAV